MSSTLSTSYQITEGKPLTLKITIGYGQAGVTSVYLNRKALANNRKDSFELPIASGEPLKGNTLYCFTTVTDIRKETDRTGVMYELQGGVADFKQVLEEGVKGAGATYSYMAAFDFYV
jgi:hypothetical protein